MARAPKAKRYAQALFNLAQEQGKEQAWLDELAVAVESLTGTDVTLFFSSVRIPLERKLRVMRELFPGRDQAVMNLIGLLLRRNAIDLLPDIQTSYRELLDEKLGRVYANVSSAVPLTADQQDRLRQTLSGALNKDVILDVRQDPEIIGGLVVRVGDQIIDGSVRSRLEALRRRLLQESLT